MRDLRGRAKSEGTKGSRDLPDVETWVCEVATGVRARDSCHFPHPLGEVSRAGDTGHSAARPLLLSLVKA